MTAKNVDTPPSLLTGNRLEIIPEPCFTGNRLARLLLKHYARYMEEAHATHSRGYQSTVDLILVLLIEFCRGRTAAHPWDMRDAYLIERNKRKGYCQDMCRLAAQVTRRYMAWLQREGHLPWGTVPEHHLRRAPRGPDEEYAFFAAKLDASLPVGLREPALKYLMHAVYDRQMATATLWRIMRVITVLCRQLAAQGLGSYAPLRVAQLDATVSALVSAPVHEVQRRRRLVQSYNSVLRCFMRYLRAQGVISRDLDRALISPPYYRTRAPQQVLSSEQLSTMLESIDRTSAKGRRSYAIVLLIATYGLRSVDVALLTLDDIDWRKESISLVQHKTKQALYLPLMTDVARAIYEHLRHDRDLKVAHRHVFLTLREPSEPLSPAYVGQVVKDSARRAGFPRVGARTLRASVVTNLMRQGEPLGDIADIVGHRSIETTRSYAAIDTQLLRRVLDEEER